MSTINLPVEISFALTADLRKSTLQDIVWDLRRESRRALLRALRGVVEQVEKALIASGVVCPVCTRSMRSRGRSARRIVTILGTIEIARARYGCRTCGTTRRPLDEWLGLLTGTEYTVAVGEQALYLAADLPYDRAAEVLRHVGGIGMSGRQIQRLLRTESSHIEAALGASVDERSEALGHRFRRAGRGETSAGARRVSQLRQLKTSGLWDRYWADRIRAERRSAHPVPPRKADRSR
jgi:hypothetical protein